LQRKQLNCLYSLKVIDSKFVTSATSVAGFPKDGIPQIAFVGRSNVGKSSLINALIRQKIARTSAAPGKTRLINFYRVHISGVKKVSVSESRSDKPRFTGSLYLVDLPGYGYARGGAKSAQAFDVLTQDYFGHVSGTGKAWPKRNGNVTSVVTPSLTALTGTVLTIDSRHPGLQRDIAARDWIENFGLPFVVVATKVDALGRAARVRTLRESEDILNTPLLPVASATGEGLSELWKLIIKLVTT
jgi:GTP-binding protein